MIDGEGHLGEAEKAKRQQVIDNHKKWVEAAKFLGCHSIRVNAHGKGKSDEEKQNQKTDAAHGPDRRKGGGSRSLGGDRAISPSPRARAPDA